MLALALTDDVVAVYKSNDLLMWWQGASQMIDQYGNAVVEGKSNDLLKWWQGASQMTN